MFVQELRITHSDQTCLSLASGWKKGTPYPLFEGVFIEIHVEAKPLSAKKLPYQNVCSRASHHPFWPKMPFINFWLKKRVPPIHFLRVSSLKFILKQNHWVPRSSHIRMFVQELRITHSDQTCLSLASGWKKGTPYPLFEGVFIEIHVEAKPLSAKKLPYQDVRSRTSHHPFWPKMPFISFWLKKGYPLSTFGGCFHWISKTNTLNTFNQCVPKRLQVLETFPNFPRTFWRNFPALRGC